MSNIELITELATETRLPYEALVELLATFTREDREHATSLAYRAARDHFGTDLHAWGVIQMTAHGPRDTYLTRPTPDSVGRSRARLSSDEVLRACGQAYALGFRTFVLAAGEDAAGDADVNDEIIWRVRKHFPEAAIALAFGERSRSTYQRYFDAGADRYLLRHEAADPEHFAQLHPRRCTLTNRKRALNDLKDIGYQVGTGMLVGTPFQTPERLAADLEFLGEFDPQIVTLGPFVPELSSVFPDEPAGSLESTLFVLSLVRLMLPDALVPALASVAKLHKGARELAVMAGANVLMLDITPGPDAHGEGGVGDAPDPHLQALVEKLERRVDALGYRLAADRGDYRTTVG